MGLLVIERPVAAALPVALKKAQPGTPAGKVLAGAHGVISDPP